MELKELVSDIADALVRIDGYGEPFRNSSWASDPTASPS